MKIILDQRPMEVAPGTTVLAACRAAGINVPTLCEDDRLKPTGSCRLCLVNIKGAGHLLPACSTETAEGMEIDTRTDEVLENRQTVLQMLAKDYPNEAVKKHAEKPFHQLLAQYGTVTDAMTNGDDSTETAPVPFKDLSHPYIAVDMSRCIHCTRCVHVCAELQGQFVWHTLGRGAQTYIVPDGPTLLSSSCVSCGACVEACPTGALEDQSILRYGVPEHWTRTTCPYCGTGCEMLVGTRGDRIVQIKPAKDAAVNKGHLCVKGRYAWDFVQAQDRITSPMIRENGEWRKAEWGEALQYVARKLQSITKTHGPDSVGVLGSARGTNEENYLAQKFARVVLGTNNVDCCARVCHAPTATGMKQTLGTGAATNSFDDIEKAKTILICGCNPTENHPIVGARIKQAVLHGAKLIVIDPREIELARYADVHLALRPGTNVPLLNALASVIVSEALTDETAIGTRVDNFEAFKGFVRAWTPERATAITGVPADLIRKAARLYAGEKPSMCFHGLGTTEHIQGTDGVMCLVNLALITGNFGQPGTGVNPLRGQNNVQGAAHMGCEPGNLTGYVPLEAGRTLFEAAWHAPIPQKHGLNLMEMVDAAARSSLKAMWAIGYDIALTNPNATATKAALANLELIVVQDLFLNELAREFGHVFLPACSTFERDGTFMNSERRVQRIRKALEPRGESRPDWRIICDLASEMGFGARFDFSTPEQIWDEIRTVWKAGAGISYARIDHDGLQWPCPDENHPGTTILHQDSFPMGPRAQLVCVDYIATPEQTTAEFPWLLTTGRTLYQFNAGTMTMRTPNAELRGNDTLDIAPEDALRLSLHDGARAKVRSRHGETILCVRVDSRMKPGELFATFHAAESGLNQLTSPQRDRGAMTPEYKVVAVDVEKAFP